MTKFGHQFKKEHFPLSDNDFVPVNHGSFGLPPQVVVDKFNESIELDLASPDAHHYTILPEMYRESLKPVAKLLNCSYKQLAFVENATTGVNTVLRSFPFKKGDKVALPTTTYGACANTVKFLANRVGIVPIWIELNFPLSDAEIVEAFRKVFEQNEIKLALFDTIVSMPGMKLPFEELTKLCKEFGVVSLIDGAHSIGLIPVDLSAVAPDYYVSNLHKWLSLPRGLAVLYVDPKHFRTIQTLPISHSYLDPDAELSAEQLEDLLLNKFEFTGSKTTGRVACVDTAIKFRNEVCGGEDAIREYCFDLAKQVGELVEKSWPGSSVIENKEGTLGSAMVTAFIPIENYSKLFDASKPADVAPLIKFLAEYQIKQFRTYTPFAAHAGKIVIRYSGQVYNEISDYEYAIDAAQKSLEAYFAQGQDETPVKKFASIDLSK